MRAENDKDFRRETDKPVVQQIGYGCCYDSQVESKDGRIVRVRFRVEARTIRLNHVGLNAWLDSKPPHWPPEDDGLTQEEYERETMERTIRRTELEKQIQADLGIDTATCGFSISQTVGEFFSVVTIERIGEEPVQDTPQT